MDKIKFEDQNILERLYQSTSTGETLTYEDFLKLPLNNEYQKQQEKKLSSSNILPTDGIKISKE